MIEVSKEFHNLEFRNFLYSVYSKRCTMCDSNHIMQRIKPITNEKNYIKNFISHSSELLRCSKNFALLGHNGQNHQIYWSRLDAQFCVFVPKFCGLVEDFYKRLKVCMGRNYLLEQWERKPDDCHLPFFLFGYYWWLLSSFSKRKFQP